MRKYNYNLIKKLYSIDNIEIENYRYYLIVKRHYVHKSSIFSIDELLDFLHDKYACKSLHRLPGNYRTRLKRKLIKQFNNSILFNELTDGRFLAIAERKIVKRSKNNIDHPVFENDLISQKNFNNAVIGTYQLKSRFKSYGDVSKELNISASRVQKAAHVNDENNRILKVNNLVVPEGDFQKSPQKIYNYQDELIRKHKIRPKVIKFNYRSGKLNKWVTQKLLTVYIANSYYSCIDSDGATIPASIIRRSANLTQKKEKSKIEPLKLNYNSRIDLWSFNDSVYNLSDYLEQHEDL